MQLEGAYNVRHVGGYVTKDGRLTRPNLFFRSDSLHRLTAADQQQLLDSGLRTIIDLRRQTEVESQPNVFANSTVVNYRHLPLYNDWSEVVDDGRRLQGLAHLYQLILDYCHETICRVVAAIADPQTLPVLIHCAVGKDRTGIITALLLGATNVLEETIVADYALSYDYLTPLINEFRREAVRNGFDMDLYETFLRSPPQAMRQTLDHLSNNYGGVRAYLKTIGLRETQLVTLANQLVG